jgi:hypothetical protein
MKKLLISACLLVSGPALGGFFNGNELFAYCSKDRDFVSGYVAGAFDKAEVDLSVFVEFAAANPIPSDSKQPYDIEAYLKAANEIQGYCRPKRATVSQTTDVYCQYLTLNPGNRHLPGATLLTLALASTWPCPAIEPSPPAKTKK